MKYSQIYKLYKCMFCKGNLTQRIVKGDRDVSMHCLKCRYDNHELTKKYGLSKYYISIQAGTGQIQHAHIDTPQHYISIDFVTPRTSIWKFKGDVDGNIDNQPIVLMTAKFDLHDYEAFIRQLKMFIAFS